MLKNLRYEAARSLRNSGWYQQADPTLFWHPKFGAHEFFKACYIQAIDARTLRRRRTKTIVTVVSAAILLVAAVTTVVFTLNAIGIL